MSVTRLWNIVAMDDADEDGGTLYCLRNEHSEWVAMASWPQPLEQLAREFGAIAHSAPSPAPGFSVRVGDPDWT